MMALACAIEQHANAHGWAVVLRLPFHVRRPSHREVSESRRTKVGRGQVPSILPRGAFPIYTG